jgi:E3 ubiquitin-protein ligase UBR4
MCDMCVCVDVCVQAIWLPGSQTELAIVTADFVKIYDLSIDALSPQYYFMPSQGKIRDATFVTSECDRYLLLMSSAGYIYEQVMDSASGAQNGQFFITNVLGVKHPDVKVIFNQLFEFWFSGNFDWYGKCKHS